MQIFWEDWGSNCRLSGWRTTTLPTLPPQIRQIFKRMSNVSCIFPKMSTSSFKGVTNTTVMVQFTFFIKSAWLVTSSACLSLSWVNRTSAAWALPGRHDTGCFSNVQQHSCFSSACTQNRIYSLSASFSPICAPTLATLLHRRPCTSIRRCSFSTIAICLWVRCSSTSASRWFTWDFNSITHLWACGQEGQGVCTSRKTHEVRHSAWWCVRKHMGVGNSSSGRDTRPWSLCAQMLKFTSKIFILTILLWVTTKSNLTLSEDLWYLRQIYVHKAN